MLKSVSWYFSIFPRLKTKSLGDLIPGHFSNLIFIILPLAYLHDCLELSCHRASFILLFLPPGMLFSKCVITPVFKVSAQILLYQKGLPWLSYKTVNSSILIPLSSFIFPLVHTTTGYTLHLFFFNCLIPSTEMEAAKR